MDTNSTEGMAIHFDTIEMAKLGAVMCLAVFLAIWINNNL